MTHYSIRLRYWIDFNKWEVFVNDDGTRTFLSMEVTAKGLAEVCIVSRSSLVSESFSRKIYHYFVS